MLGLVTGDSGGGLDDSGGVTWKSWWSLVFDLILLEALVCVSHSVLNSINVDCSVRMEVCLHDKDVSTMTIQQCLKR